MSSQYQYHREPTSQEVASIKVTFADRVSYVPLDPANSDYAEIMRQVEAGELTIQEADS